jgi:hypothetical protein
VLELLGECLPTEEEDKKEKQRLRSSTVAAFNVRIFFPARNQRSTKIFNDDECLQLCAVCRGVRYSKVLKAVNISTLWKDRPN